MISARSIQSDHFWRTGLSLAIILVASVSDAAEPAQVVNWDEAAARHLLSRACFGGSPEQARKLAALPLEKAVDQLLDDAASAQPFEKPGWVRDLRVNTLCRPTGVPRDEYLGHVPAGWHPQRRGAGRPEGPQAAGRDDGEDAATRADDVLETGADMLLLRSRGPR